MPDTGSSSEKMWRHFFTVNLLVLHCLHLQGQTPQTKHPRLFLQANDLPRLQAWATASNPVYAAGLAVQAEKAKLAMDTVDPNNIPPSPNVPFADNGSRGYQGYPTEQYAELFAYMSLLSTNAAEKLDYARRATNLLMYAINQAALGPSTNSPPTAFRDPNFYTYDSDRPRWYGEAWPLTVDWIYPYLSPQDKATIRTVFLRWANEIVSVPGSYAKPPSPQGVTNNPILFEKGTYFGRYYDPVRYSGNNYFCAHMRNLGLMAMAFDPADDPGNLLRNYLSAATGSFLYTVDHLLRTDSAGGLLPEGFEYSPQTAAYIVQFLLALHTAGQDDPTIWGQQVVLTNQPFWGDFIHAYLNSLSPNLGSDTQNSDRPFYYAAWYGDGSHIYAPDFIHSIGPLGLFAFSMGDTNRLNTVRWIEQNLPPGGAGQFLGRAGADVNGDSSTFSDNIFYFMLYDPLGAVPVDPRPTEPLNWFAPGMQRILSRTGWDTNATWFTYKLGWSHVPHQLSDGNQFEFFRRGEWLTKERTGYDLDDGSSDNHNTLALQNDFPILSDTNDYRYVLYSRGSQWAMLSSPDPRIVGYSLGSNLVAVTGNSTSLYNDLEAENSADILHASRSMIWVKPDHIIIYDRAISKTAGRFKRFWLNTATAATVSGNQGSVTMASGQKLFTTTLLPANATITSELYTKAVPYGDLAPLEPMGYRLRIEAPGGPANVRFLNVLQGADSAQSRDNPTLLNTSDGTPFQGTLVKNNAILFPIDLGNAVTNFTYIVPTNITTHYISGLNANAAYLIAAQSVGIDTQITIMPGGRAFFADSGGVLVLFSGTQPISSTTRLRNGNALLRFSEIAGGPYYIQASTDLKTWADIGPAQRELNGAFQFEDVDAASFPKRYYRKVAR